MIDSSFSISCIHSFVLFAAAAAIEYLLALSSSRLVPILEFMEVLVSCDFSSSSFSS